RAGRSPRVLMVTSGAAHRARLKPYWGPYAITKAGLEALARTYAAECENVSEIKVMLANPGPLRTAMRARAMPGEDPATLKTPEEFAQKALPLVSRQWRHTGKIYDFPTDRIMEFADPVAVSGA